MSHGVERYQVAVIGASGYTGGELIRLLASHPAVEIKVVVAHQSSGMTLGQVHPGLRRGGQGGDLASLGILSYENDFIPWVRQDTPNGGLSSREFHDPQGTQGTFNTLTNSMIMSKEIKSFRSIFDEIDVFFLALPHGEAARVLPSLVTDADERPAQGSSGVSTVGQKKRKKPLFFDLSGDFRLKDSKVHEKFYGFPAPDRQVQKRFIYGSPEIFREEIQGTSSYRQGNHRGRFFSLPGCFATACNLGLAPLAQAGLLRGKWVLDCVTGSSGAGNRLGRGTHHPERDENLFAYKPFSHQHHPEIEQTQAYLDSVYGGGRGDFRLVFQPHSGPFVRGIYGTFHGEIFDEGNRAGVGGRKKESVRDLFRNFYAKAPMVRLVEQPPELRHIRGTNFVDIFVYEKDQDLMICVALDNLIKGAAGQAVQAMNLALGFDETVALEQLAPAV